MEAANENRPADTDYKRGLLRFAPWKIVIAAFAAAAIIFGALGYKLDSSRRRRSSVSSFRRPRRIEQRRRPRPHRRGAGGADRAVAAGNR